MIGRRFGAWMSGALLAATLGALPPAAAETTRVDGAFQLKTALRNAAPGDVIEIAGGVYSDLVIYTPRGRSGTSESPIILRPQSPAGVTLTGGSAIILNGDYLVVEGLVFERANRGDAVIRVDGAHARLTGLAFRDSGDPDDKNATLIKIFGPYAEVDHSTFADNVCGGIKVSPNPAEDGAAILASHAHIHHNVFRGSDRRFPNGCEPIQLGTGANGKLDGAALVEHNTFDRVNSDSEIISVKTSGNAIRNNTITDSDGYISLRVGRNNVVEGNVIVHGAWGISVADGGHVIVNNFIRDPRRQVGIYLIAARWKTFADGSLKQHYANAHDNLIMHNTVVAEIPLFFGNIFNSGITDSPAGNQFINNIFVVTGAATTAIDGNNGFSPSSALSANVFVRNLFYPQGGGTDFAVPLPGSGPDANLLGDPLLDFADPAVPRLRSGSAAIGAAKALAPAVGYDIRGAVRAGGADIGAYEYGDDD